MAQAQQWDEVLRLLSWWDAEKVAAAKIMVVGAGALGNEVLKNLALLNVGYILIVDFDVIEYSNLSRSILYRPADVDRPKAPVAAQRIREVNPNCVVQYLEGDISFDIGLGIFRRMDVIIGCLDNRIARLYINRHAHRVNKTWINGGILNLSGMLEVFRPGVSCYECQLRTKEWDIIRYRVGCTDIARRNANYGRLPTTPISASVIGALQVQEAFKIIYENNAASLAGQRFFMDGESNEMLFYPSGRLKSYCPSHGSLEAIEEAVELSSEHSTVAELFAWLEERFPGEAPRVLLEDYDIVLQLHNESTDERFPVVLPRFRLSEQVLSQYQRQAGEMIRIPRDQTLDYLDADFPAPDKTLAEVGIPKLQVLTVEVGESYHFIELTGDAGWLELPQTEITINEAK